MFTDRLQVFLMIAVIIYFITVYQLLKRKTLNLKYTLLWLASGLLMLVLVIFPNILQIFADLVGIATPMNALFSVAFFCIILILMSLTAIVSKLNWKTKTLIQTLALLENRVREQEAKRAENSDIT